jgi:hypothetical protein
VPDPWMPGAIRDPGRGAGYRVGRTQMTTCCMHATAGTNSYNIVKNGVPGAPSTLAQWLVPYDGPPWQFTEADALCYDSPPNWDGPGIEIERPVVEYHTPLSEFRPLSGSQIHWTGQIVGWLHREWGFPLELYSGPRLQFLGFRGFCNHCDMTTQRSDGVNRQEWDQIVAASGGVVPGPPVVDEGYEEESMLLVAMDRDGMFAKKGHLYLLDSLGAVDLHPEPASSFNRTPQGIVSMTTLDTLIGDRLVRAQKLGLIG